MGRIASCPWKRFAVKVGSLLGQTYNLLVVDFVRGVVFIPFVLREGGEEYWASFMGVLSSVICFSYLVTLTFLGGFLICIFYDLIDVARDGLLGFRKLCQDISVYKDFYVKSILWIRNWVSLQCNARELIQTVWVLIDFKWFLSECVVLEKRLVLLKSLRRYFSCTWGT